MRTRELDVIMSTTSAVFVVVSSLWFHLTNIFLRVYRCPDTSLTSGKTEPALVPLLDMLNHRRKPNARWFYDWDRRGFTLVATRYISAGSTIHDTYGQRSNQEYLKAYGFVFDGYPVAQHRVRLPYGRVQDTNISNISGTAQAEEQLDSEDASLSANVSNTSTNTLHVPEELLLHTTVSVPVQLSAMLDVYSWGCNSSVIHQDLPFVSSSTSMNAIAKVGLPSNDRRSEAWFKWIVHAGFGGRGTNCIILVRSLIILEMAFYIQLGTFGLWGYLLSYRTYG